MNVLFQEKDGKKIKLTVAQDNNVRIKIPKSLNQDDQNYYKAMLCDIAADVLQKGLNVNSLRGDFFPGDKGIALCSGNNKTKKFVISYVFSGLAQLVRAPV